MYQLPIQSEIYQTYSRICESLRGAYSSIADPGLEYTVRILSEHDPEIIGNGFFWHKGVPTAAGNILIAIGVLMLGKGIKDRNPKWIIGGVALEGITAILYFKHF